MDVEHFGVRRTVCVRDIVKKDIEKSPETYVAAVSTVPYSHVFFGIYELISVDNEMYLTP